MKRIYSEKWEVPTEEATEDLGAFVKTLHNFVKSKTEEGYNTIELEHYLIKTVSCLCSQHRTLRNIKKRKEERNYEIERH